MVETKDETVEKGTTFIPQLDKKIQLLAKMTNFDEPLSNVVRTDTFQSYVAPLFDKVSKKLLRRSIIDAYVVSKKELKESLCKFDGRFVVSCDLWDGFGGYDRFVCVSCYWVSKDWCLEKRVLGFELFYPCGHVDVVSKMVGVLEEFGVKEKVGSVSFEDGVSKEKCVGCLGDGFDTKVLEMFCHDRGFGNVVDICGKMIVDQLSEFIEPVMELVKWFRSCPEKRREFKTLCKSMSLRPSTRFRLDSSKGWRSTFECLKGVEGNKEALSKIYNECGNHSPLEESHWDAVGGVLSLLEKFDDAFGRFSRPYQASCHLVIYDCITIVHRLNSFKSDPKFGSVVKNVMRKWKQLFPEIPTVYCVATVLDPRFKVEGLRQLLVYYYESLGKKYNVDEKVANCENALKQLHARSSVHERFFSRDDEFEVFTVMKRKRVDNEEIIGDLGEFLFFEFEFSKDDNDKWFDILKWWKEREKLFPVVSKVAKEVLCTPVFTTIPKSDCCPGKRVLDEKRSRLRQDLIQFCICKKDWDLAERGRLGQDEDYRSDSSDSEADDCYSVA